MWWQSVGSNEIPNIVITQLKGPFSLLAGLADDMVTLKQNSGSSSRTVEAAPDQAIAGKSDVEPKIPHPVREILLEMAANGPEPTFVECLRVPHASACKDVLTPNSSDVSVASYSIAERANAITAFTQAMDRAGYKSIGVIRLATDNEFLKRHYSSAQLAENARAVAGESSRSGNETALSGQAGITDDSNTIRLDATALDSLLRYQLPGGQISPEIILRQVSAHELTHKLLIAEDGLSWQNFDSWQQIENSPKGIPLSSSGAHEFLARTAEFSESRDSAIDSLTLLVTTRCAPSESGGYSVRDEYSPSNGDKDRIQLSDPKAYSYSNAFAAEQLENALGKHAINMRAAITQPHFVDLVRSTLTDEDKKEIKQAFDKHADAILEQIRARSRREVE